MLFLCEKRFFFFYQDETNESWRTRLVIILNKEKCHSKSKTDDEENNHRNILKIYPLYYWMVIVYILNKFIMVNNFNLLDLIFPVA